MHSRTTVGTMLALAALLLLAACDEREIAGLEPGDAGAVARAAADVPAAPAAFTIRASGGGHFFESWFSGITWHFAFTAVQRDAAGHATGFFRFRSTWEGMTVADFEARVTCLRVDPEHKRAWIGGIITRNGSEHPVFRDDPIVQIGQPTWFRVADNGEGPHADADRITRNFFTGAGGFQSEWEFCTAEPPFWPVVGGVERFTDPLTGGTISVHVR
jgi:hypothetical protein